MKQTEGINAVHEWPAFTKGFPRLMRDMKMQDDNDLTISASNDNG